MALQERALRTRANLIRAAAQVFDRVGYQRATLMTISEQAEVTKGGLSFHFTTKSELAQAVQIEACAISAAVLEDLADRPGPALDIVVDMAHALAGLLHNDVVVRAGARLAQEVETPEDPALHSQLYWLSTLHRTLCRASGDGSLADGTDVRSAAALVMSVTMGAEMLARMPYQHAFGQPQPEEGQQESPQQWLSRVWRVLRPVLAGAPTGPGGHRPAATPNGHARSPMNRATVHAVAASAGVPAVSAIPAQGVR
ncbi:TetR/AcrR family transcriptional regulator [Streptomyces sp. NA04227]|uniref:ScbR family autoregulator-binding transcription factor n=1 Tax=Streptomyces sp. NA04227 TaxID=2742136 RepID=UPI00159017D1|nr:ScbR family autoregulator-binding transcription factor [Streptomyces sp. NA04227]QKW08432.1 TetR/AcrR family transcriptional regulator [Streptomyces sp. NA04227]